MRTARRRIVAFYVVTFGATHLAVVAPAILHGTADATVLLTLALVHGGGELTTGWGSLSSIAILIVVDTFIALSMRRTTRAPT